MHINIIYLKRLKQCTYNNKSNDLNPLKIAGMELSTQERIQVGDLQNLYWFGEFHQICCGHVIRIIFLSMVIRRLKTDFALKTLGTGEEKFQSCLCQIWARMMNMLQGKKESKFRKRRPSFNLRFKLTKDKNCEMVIFRFYCKIIFRPSEDDFGLKMILQ